MNSKWFLIKFVSRLYVFKHNICPDLSLNKLMHVINQNDALLPKCFMSRANAPFIIYLKNEVACGAV